MVKSTEGEDSYKLQAKLDISDTKPLYRYRLDIDGLRGIAVILVIIFHAKEALIPSGFRGVDIFFVISGYVVAASILRHQSKSLFDYFIGFYKRRVLRLMPALLACVLLTTVVGSLFINPSLFSKALGVGGSALIGWSNNHLIASGSDYFGVSTTLNPFTHTWSLGVEEQFYFVFPAVLAAVYGLRRPLQNKRLAVGLLTALVVISGLYCLHLSIENPLKAYYFMPSRFWEMAAGALLFSTFTAWPSFIYSIEKQRWLSYACQIGAVGLIAASLSVIPPEALFLGALTTTIGTLLFIAAGLSSTSFLNRFCTKSLWTYVGRLSYSLYLWHWPVFVLLQWTIGIDSVVNVLIGLCATVVLAIASYYLIEQPVRKMKTLHYRRVFIVALTCLCIVGTSGVAIAKSPMNANLYLYREYNSEDWSPFNKSTSDEGNQTLKQDCRITKADADLAIIEEKFERCTQSAASPERAHLFLIGDSYAASSIPMLDKIRAEEQIGTTSLYAPGCLFSLEISLAGKYEVCPQQFGNALNLVEAQAKAGDTILIVSRYANISPEAPISKAAQNQPRHEIVHHGEGKEIISEEKAHLQIAEELVDIADRFKDKGVKIVIQAPLPEHHLPSVMCVPAWFSGRDARPDCLTEKQLSLRRRERFMDLLREVQEQTENVYVWDVFDELCPNAMCAHFDGDKPLFYDDNHLSVYGSKTLSTHFMNFLKSDSL